MSAADRRWAYVAAWVAVVGVISASREASMTIVLIQVAFFTFIVSVLLKPEAKR